MNPHRDNMLPSTLNLCMRTIGISSAMRLHGARAEVKINLKTSTRVQSWKVTKVKIFLSNSRKAGCFFKKRFKKKEWNYGGV